MAFAITIPRLGWTMDEGIFVSWLKKDGDAVKEGEPIFTLESEKAAQEVESTEAGILRISPTGPAAGSTVLVGALIGYLVVEGEAVTFDKPPAHQPQTKTSATPAMSAPTPRSTGVPPVSSTLKTGETPVLRNSSLTISPRAARTAAALDVDWTKITGTGRTGRIRERDILAAASRPSARVAPTPAPIVDETLTGKTAPLSPTRRTIARRMSAGVHEAAPVTLTAKADATNLVALRRQLKSAAPSDQPIPTLNDFFVKLVAAALKEHPAMMAQWRTDSIFHPDAINISIAVDTNDGLIAPVIHNVPALKIEQIAAQSRALIDRARNGRLTPPDLKGGVFTVTNLGGLGIDFFTPIINLPQCAILGVGRINREPIFIESRISAREIVPLSLTFDHRLVDGAPAARFLGALVRFIGNPTQYLDC